MSPEAKTAIIAAIVSVVFGAISILASHRFSQKPNGPMLILFIVGGIISPMAVYIAAIAGFVGTHELVRLLLALIAAIIVLNVVIGIGKKNIKRGRDLSKDVRKI